MYFKVFFVVLTLLFFLPLKAQERIEWDEDRPLQWSDFKASPDYLLEYVATTNSGITHGYTINGNGVLDKSQSTVYAHFYPEYSWYKPEDISADLLNHEQRHFDITELHARILRMRIFEYNFTTNSKEEIAQLYNHVEAERRVMQRLFDNETNHSRDKAQEAVWKKKISHLLEEHWVYTQ